MAVQSSHPADNLLPDLLRRVRSAEMKSGLSSNLMKGQAHAEDSPSSPWVHFFQAPTAACQQQPVKSTMSRLKRTWEAACAVDEPLLVKRLASGALPFNTAAAPVFTGLRLATSSPLVNDTAALPQASTSGFHPPDFSAALLACMDGHANDVVLLIDAQANAMKLAIEEKRSMHTQALVSLVEDHVVKRLKKKDEELEKARMRTMELEDGLKQMSLELQLWKNLAKNNELMALNLKQNLEQVAAQMREQKHQHLQACQHMSREEGCGESEVDDAVSSCRRGRSGEGAFHNQECRDVMEQRRRCKCCRVNEVCVLLLPCRHLCLCLECAGELHKCPLCGTMKNASLQIYP